MVAFVRIGTHVSCAVGVVVKGGSGLKEKTVWALCGGGCWAVLSMIFVKGHVRRFRLGPCP